METEFPNTTGGGGGDIFVVEKLLKKRRHPSKGVQYLVKWRGYPNSENTWEPVTNFSPQLIDIFESNKNKGRQKPTLPKTLPRQSTGALSVEATTSKQHLIPSSSSSLTSSSSCSSSSSALSSASTEIISLEPQPKCSRGRPRKYTAQQEDLTEVDPNQPLDELLRDDTSTYEQTSSPMRKIPKSSASRSRLRKNPSERREQQVRLQRHIEEQQRYMVSSEESNLNSTGNHPQPTKKEVVREVKLTKEPIIVTDVTAKDLTVTISECITSEGFFRK